MLQIVTTFVLYLIISRAFHNWPANFKKVQYNDNLSFIKHFFDVIQWLNGQHLFSFGRIVRCGAGKKIVD